MAIAMRLFTHHRTCESGSSLLYAMTRLNWESTTRAYLPRFTSTERTKGKKWFLWSWKCLPCLSFLIFSHLGSSDVIGLYLYVFTSASTSLTSMMVLTLRSYTTRIVTYPCVSLCLSLPWRIFFLDMVRPWCIRGLARTHAEVKARWDR